MGDGVEVSHKICLSCLPVGEDLSLFYTWYISACVNAIFGLVQMETVTFILSKGDFLAVVVSRVNKFTPRTKIKCSPLHKCAKTVKQRKSSA